MLQRRIALLAAVLFAVGGSLASIPASAVQAKKVSAAKSGTKTPSPAAQATAKPVASRAKAERAPEAVAVDADGNPLLRSSAVVVADQASGEVLYQKNSDSVLPIASITKLMTAMVVLDAQQPLDEPLTVSEDDVDTLRGSRSRLALGTVLSREDMLRLALMSSENRAAHALGRHYPGGLAAFVEAMNRKAADLGLQDTRFSDPTGLSAANVSSARDLVKMVAGASQYPLIREFSTAGEYSVQLNGRAREFRNTNSLVMNPQWEIGVSKTGYISEAGRCLVMQTWIQSRPMIIVLLDSWGKLTRVADANRVKRWVERQVALRRT